MKIVDAVWEKRNLGVTTCEVTIEPEDTLDEVNSACDDLSKQFEYLVFRIPSNRSDLVLPMQMNNFRYIETQFTFMTSAKNVRIPEKYSVLYEQTSWQLMNEKDLERLYDEIRGGIFHTDRIYLDPYFTHELAAQRYLFWIQDLVSQGHLPYKVTFEGEDVGFFINKPIEKNLYRGVLNGAYRKILDSGMGVLTAYATSMFLKEKNLNVTGASSSNNISMVRISLEFGSTIKSLDYIFIKHTH